MYCGHIQARSIRQCRARHVRTSDQSRILKLCGQLRGSIDLPARRYVHERCLCTAACILQSPGRTRVYRSRVNMPIAAGARRPSSDARAAALQSEEDATSVHTARGTSTRTSATAVQCARAAGRGARKDLLLAVAKLPICSGYPWTSLEPWREYRSSGLPGAEI